MDPQQYITDIARPARAASGQLATMTGQQRNDALRGCAASLRDASATIQAENAKDLAKSDELGLTEAMKKRLVLDDTKIEAMAVALEDIAAQVDPVGKMIEGYNRPNGLRIEKRRVPIGVVGIIFESRPNVTSDAAGLCLKSGNACILRGGKEAIHSNLAIAEALKKGLAAAGLPEAAVTVEIELELLGGTIRSYWGETVPLDVPVLEEGALVIDLAPLFRAGSALRVLLEIEFE